MVRTLPSRVAPWYWLIGVVVLGVMAAIALLVGPVSVPLSEILATIVGKLSRNPVLDVSQAHQAIIWEIRAPRVALGVLVGGMLGMSGAAYQGVFRNALADPYLLGVAAGAGLGATLAIVAGGGSTWLPVAAFVGAIAAAGVTYAIGSVSASGSVNSLILAGVAVAAFFTACQTYIQQRNADTLREVYSWILGRLSTSGWSEVLSVLPYVAASAAILFASRRLLDVLALGDDEAEALGVPVTRVRLSIVAAATMGTAAVVAVSGLIGFVGIIVPHMLRLIFGSSYRLLMPMTFFLGGAFVVGADLAARTLAQPSELPIGVVTAFLGAPFFAMILRRKTRSA